LWRRVSAAAAAVDNAAVRGLLVVSALCSSAAVAGEPVVAVFHLEVKGAGLKSAAVASLSDYLATRVAASGKYKVVPRAEVERLLSAAKVQSYKSCYDEACQIELGKQLAAEKTLQSKVSKIGSACVVTLALYDLREAATERAGTGRGACTEDGVLASIDVALRELTGAPIDVARTDPKPPAKVEPPKVEPPKIEPRATTPIAPSLEARSDHRPARAQTLLVQEIDALERLLKDTPKSAAERPQITFRLAETYGELAASARRARLEAEEAARKASDEKVIAKRSADARRAQKVEDASLERQIAAYRRITKEVTSYARMDEVLFQLAECERMKGSDPTGGYRDLIRAYPSSRLVPDAHLMLGEQAFARGDYSKASEHYGQAARFDAPRTRAFATYKLAHVHWRKGDARGADRDFSKTIELADAHPGEAWAEALSRAASSDRAKLR
jgi:TolA-binding protein